MAIYHLHVQTLGRRAGRSATAAAAYRAAERITDERTGQVHDYTRRTGVHFREILLPACAPTQYADRSTLWNAAERAEKRADARVARELDVALPKELAPAEMIRLAIEFVRSQMVSMGMAADVCLHDVDGDNPHFHVLLSTRELEAGGFGQKRRDWDAWGDASAPSGSVVERWRIAWGQMANAALEAASSMERIDHRTLAAQGIDRLPTVHLGRWHGVNGNRRTPRVRAGVSPRAVPWSGTALELRDRRTRRNSLIQRINASTGLLGPAPELLAPVVARHLTRRLDRWTQEHDEGLLRRRASASIPDVEAWIRRSRKGKRLAASVEAAERALAELRRQQEVLRAFAAEAWQRAATAVGAAMKRVQSARDALSAWEERARSRLARWVSRRLSDAREAERVLAARDAMRSERDRCAALVAAERRSASAA